MHLYSERKEQISYVLYIYVILVAAFDSWMFSFH